jgi:hypothetical protein
MLKMGICATPYCGSIWIYIWGSNKGDYYDYYNVQSDRIYPTIQYIGLLETWVSKTKKKLHGLSPRANYTDRATAACRRSDANFCG